MIDLQKYGITGTPAVVHNPSYEVLFEANPAAIGGGIFVLAFAGVLTYLCVNSDRKVKAEYALSGRK